LLRSPEVDEKMMRPGLVLYVPVSALSLMFGEEEGHLAHKNPSHQLTYAYHHRYEWRL